jgi:hypothetical protein
LLIIYFLLSLSFAIFNNSIPKFFPKLFELQKRVHFINKLIQVLI